MPGQACKSAVGRLVNVAQPLRQAAKVMRNSRLFMRSPATIANMATPVDDFLEIDSGAVEYKLLLQKRIKCGCE